MNTKSTLKKSNILHIFLSVCEKKLQNVIHDKVAHYQQISKFIGVGRFRVLGGGARFRILGGGGAKGGPNSQQAHDVVMMSMRRNDVASTSFRRHVPTRFLIN